MKNVIKIYFIPIICCALLCALDQLSKLIIVKNLALDESIKLFENVFEIHYIRNTGSAWGMLAGKIPFLLILTVIVIFGIFYIYHNIAPYKKYALLRVALVFLLGGALGNMIDRIKLGYVVDFFDFCLINFPVFNVADIFITCSITVIIILMLFKYKSDDFDVILGDKIINSEGEFEDKKKKKDIDE